MFKSRNPSLCQDKKNSQLLLRRNCLLWTEDQGSEILLVLLIILLCNYDKKLNMIKSKGQQIHIQLLFNLKQQSKNIKQSKNEKFQSRRKRQKQNNNWQKEEFLDVINPFQLQKYLSMKLCLKEKNIIKQFNIKTNKLIQNSIIKMQESHANLNDHQDRMQSPQRFKDASRMLRKNVKLQKMGREYDQDYCLASYRKAIIFKNSMSYRIKLRDSEYEQIGIFQDTDKLKTFGLGPYFFIEYQRRIVWLFLLLSLMEGVRIYINVRGDGLNDYKSSFGSYLVATTLGNYTKNILTESDQYFITLIPFFIYTAFFIFFIMWKCLYRNAVNQQQESKQSLKPQKFCVEVEGFDETDDVNEEELQQIFSEFGAVFEVSLAREHDDCLKYFEKLEEIQQQIKQYEIQSKIEKKKHQKIEKKQQQKQKLQKQINKLQINPSVRSAYIHFQFEKTKQIMIQYFEQNYRFKKLSHACVRNLFCCCLQRNQQMKGMYKGKQLYIRSLKVPQPEDINWQSYEIQTCNKILRVIVAVLVIILFLAISCTIIGLCSIYISSHSVACDEYVIPDNVSEAQRTIKTQIHKKCFCNTNFISSFQDQQIKNYCGSLLNQVYSEQAIQYVIIITSTVVNIAFGIVSKKLVDFTHPLSFSTGYIWKTSIITIFVIVNTVILPLLLYADVFGFKATSYVSFVTVISVDVKAFLQVQKIKLYVDFQRIWYRNTSPIFVNYVILDIVLTWIFFVIYKCCCTKGYLQRQQGYIIQKVMNQKITSWKLDVCDQFASFNLVVFLTVLLSAGIPVLIPLGLINLGSKYITNRILLQSVSSRIPGLSQSFNSFPFVMIPVLLILACLVGSWMLTANPLIAAFPNMQIKNDQIDWWILNRILIVPFLFILSLLVALVFILFNTVIRFFLWIRQQCNRSKVSPTYYTKDYSTLSKFMSITHSYNIRNNIRYKNAIIKLQKFLANRNEELLLQSRIQN